MSGGAVLIPVLTDVVFVFVEVVVVGVIPVPVESAVGSEKGKEVTFAARQVLDKKARAPPRSLS